MKFEGEVLTINEDIFWTRGVSKAMETLSDPISCSDSQADLLYHMGLGLPYRSIIVCLGVWTGKSTIALAESAKDKGRHVYAVDHFMGSPIDSTGEVARVRDIFQEFNENLRRFG